MKSIPNITGDLEAIVRLSGASFLVPLMLYTKWMLFVLLPFYILVTVLAGYDPRKAVGQSVPFVTRRIPCRLNPNSLERFL